MVNIAQLCPLLSMAKSEVRYLAFIKAVELIRALASVFSGADTEQLRAVIREEFDRRDQLQKEPKSVSKVRSQEAEKLLAALGLQEVDGHKIDPIELPPDLAPSAEFDYSEFPNEDAGTPFLLEHHKKQLEKFGVKFGRNGFDVYDLHSIKSVYEFKSPSGQIYKGTPDGSVAPYGLFESSAALQTRILYEHKQNDQQKRKYREEHPDQFKVGLCFLASSQAACRPRCFPILSLSLVTLPLVFLLLTS